MKYFAFLIFLCLFLPACNNSISKKQSLLTPANLKSSFIELMADAAYTLKTPKGALIKIAEKSFAVTGNIKLQLEIKEAYSLQDILLAGLKTESNGLPLKSGGMIYINATADGKAVELLKPINISIPTEAYDDKMQLFKGEIAADSSINWIDPQPLDTGITARKLAKGLALFKANCASCHKPTKDFTGPMLAGSRQRAPNMEWPYKFIRNTAELLYTDPYAISLANKYKSAMPSYPSLSKEDIKAILDYCDNEALLTPFPIATTTPMPGIADSAAPTRKPCGYDTVYYARPDTASITIVPGTEIVMEEPVPADSDTAQMISAIDQTNDPTPRPPFDFTYNSSTGGMYDIAIKAFGWYNIDVFVEVYSNAVKVQMKVQLQMAIESEMNVFLFCPDKKLLTEAAKESSSAFAFKKDDETIPLFIDDKAVILAFGSKGEKKFYGTASFKIKKAQTITIEVKETTEAALQSFIRRNNIDGIKIDLNKKDEFKIEAKPCDGIYPEKAAKVDTIKNGS